MGGEVTLDNVRVVVAHRRAQGNRAGRRTIVGTSRNGLPICILPEDNNFWKVTLKVREVPFQVEGTHLYPQPCRNGKEFRGTVDHPTWTRVEYRDPKSTNRHFIPFS